MRVSFTPFLRKKAATATVGTLYVRISLQQKHIYLNLNEFLPVKNWQAKPGRVKGGHPNAAAINDLILMEMAKAHATVLQLKLSGAAITYQSVLQAVRPEVKKMPALSFANLVADYCEWANVGKQRVKQYGTTKTLWLRENLPVNIADCKEKDFAALRQKLAAAGMAHNTVLSHFKRFKAVFGWAHDRKLIDQNPVAAMKLGEWQTKKSYLSLPDLEKLHRCLPNLTTEQTTIGRLFLFSCYTGLRFSDTMQLKPCAVVETVNGFALNYVQHKTKKQELLPLLPQAVALLPHVYGQNFTNQYFNRVLKDIAKVAGITSVLVTAHVARHTFATIALNKGTRLEVVQSLLGHSNIKTTQGYANLFEATKFEGLALWNK